MNRCRRSIRIPDGVLLEEVVGYLGGEEAVARLRLLRNQALQHVLERYSRTSDALFRQFMFLSNVYIYSGKYIN